MRLLPLTERGPNSFRFFKANLGSFELIYTFELGFHPTQGDLPFSLTGLMSIN